MYTKHAEKRVQQRGISHEVCELLLSYGDEKFDGHGGIIQYFSEKSISLLISERGVQFCKKNIKKFKAYLVKSARDGSIITVGIDRTPHKFKVLGAA